MEGVSLTKRLKGCHHLYAGFDRDLMNVLISSNTGACFMDW